MRSGHPCAAWFPGTAFPPPFAQGHVTLWHVTAHLLICHLSSFSQCPLRSVWGQLLSDRDPRQKAVKSQGVLSILPVSTETR